jgi:hypothetical protein
MKGSPRSRRVCYLALSLLALATPLVAVGAQEKALAPAGGTVNVSVTTAAPPPPVSITLHQRHGHVTPLKGLLTHTGGGLIEVTSPSADTVIVTMSGAVIANAEMRFELDQLFEVNFDDPKVKKAKLSLEGRVIGLLRSHCKGSAEQAESCATVSCGPAALVTVCVPPHSVAGCENLTINCHEGPASVPIVPGKYTLHQTFLIAAHSDCFLLKRPSAEFAPDPALDPLWISSREPFHGIAKKDLGFQVTLKVAADEEKKDGNGDKKGAEGAPPPKESGSSDILVGPL